jgi:hypothetical protein
VDLSSGAVVLMQLRGEETGRDAGECQYLHEEPCGKFVGRSQSPVLPECATRRDIVTLAPCPHSVLTIPALYSDCSPVQH